MIDKFYHSAEIRWFLKGDRLNDLLGWFTRENELKLKTETGDYERQPNSPPFIKQDRSRTDEYLLLPACDTVEVKQRQGRLKIKSLVATARPFEINGRSPWAIGG